MKNKKLLFGILLAFLFLASFGFTYAYFSSDVFGNDQAKSITTNTGTLEITYNGGPQIKEEEVYPGWSGTKTFTVENTGSLTAYYSLDWENLINTITNDELVMSASCTGNGCKTITNQVVGNVDGPFVSGIEIEPGVIHSYTIIFTFLEMSRAQDYNQGKDFSGKIRVEESTGESAELIKVYGTLVDTDNIVIPNATVLLHSNPQTTTTDENGNFMFENVEVGNHTLTASLSGEELLEDAIVINNGNTNTIDNTTITKTSKNKEIKVKIKVGNDNAIESIEEVHYTLSSSFATTLGVAKPNIKAIAVETTLTSPETYTYNEVTYNRNINGRDVSESGNGTVLASTYTDGINDVIIMINSRGKTSLPEDLSYLFSETSSQRTSAYINIEYIQTENFNTSQVKTMYGVFAYAGQNATIFNLNLSNWDTSQVTDMSGILIYAGTYSTSWNIGDISDWDTSKVTNMTQMFSYAGSTATTWNIGDLSDWDTSQVTNMNGMFWYAGCTATTFNLDLSDWDTSQVSYMIYMFSFAGYNATTWNIGDLSEWNTSQVANMSYMFEFVGYNVTTFNLNLSNWDTSRVTNMKKMFDSAGYNATTWNIGDLSSWDTSQVTNMNSMFWSAGYNATTFNLNLSNWDISRVTDMGEMFCGAGENAITSTLNIKGFDLSLSNTTLNNYSRIFYGMKSNAQITVGSNGSRDWILGLDTSSNRPSSWNSSNIIVDDAPPTNNSVSISNGTSQIRTLTLESTGANRMCISSTSNIASNCTHWEPYKTTKEYALPKTTGNHTIYVFYRMGLGPISDAVSATATVSSIIPTYEIFDNNEYDSSFTITPGETYPWTAKNNRFENTNTGTESSTSSSTISFTPDANGTLSFGYGVISYDSDSGKLLITLTGSDSSSVTIADNIYGMQNLTYTGNVLSGVTYTLTLSYIKTTNIYGFTDSTYIDNLKIQ